MLHAAISWAIAKRLLRFDPLAGMRALPRPRIRVRTWHLSWLAG
jgi:hypothetical protein